jgi:MEDS: MEthanogen/methylotroph, DcmR Sensory domain
MSSGTPPGAPATWQTLLAAPAPGQHVGQLCTEPGFLGRAVGGFAGAGLRAGDAIIIIATPAHWQEITGPLEAQRFDLDELQGRGQLTVLNAGSCLAQLLVDDIPDPERFRAVIGGAADAVRRAGYQRVRAFGEIVDLLRQTDLTAAIRLEELWNEWLAAQGKSLLCGYSVDAFDHRAYRGLLQAVCTAHSDLIPVEDYARLEQAVERAYADVFGSAGDADGLRQAFLAEYAWPTAMPDAQAALLAAREFLPRTLDELLEKARHHYHAPAGERAC